MNIAKAKILNPVAVDRNNLKFNVNVADQPALAEIQLSRKLDGFRVRFEVRINGVLWNANDATEEDRNFFAKVEDAAAEADFARSQAAGDAARVIAKTVFLGE